MKNYLLLTFLLFNISTLFAQTLSLYQLQKLCQNANFDYVNRYLTNKGWEYFDSEKGGYDEYDQIVWSYNKSFGDIALGWFRLLISEDYPGKISYNVFEKQSFTKIQNDLKNRGYKYIDNEIGDGAVVSNYTNKDFIARLITSKRDKENSFYGDESITSYTIILFEKEGVYDPDNGEKVEYWEESENVKVRYNLKNGELHGKYTKYYTDGGIKETGYYVNGVENGTRTEYISYGKKKAEYTIVNGKYDGPFKVFFKNGKISKRGNLVNGVQEGDFEEYNEVGELVSKYQMKNDKLHGKMTQFKDGKIEEQLEFKNGVLSGNYTKYFQNEYGFSFTQNGEYLNGEKDGKWELIVKEPGGEESLISLETYSDGKKNGPFYYPMGDSLILGNYKSDELHGPYKIYFDFARYSFGGIINTDTSEMIQICDGFYINGEQTSEWKFYDLTGSLIKKGRYLYGKKNGEWSYFYTKYSSETGLEPYSGQLYLTEYYKNGIKDGKEERFSSLEEKKYLCGETDFPGLSPMDTCFKLIYRKEYQKLYYKNGKPHGPAIYKDSLGTTTIEGYFVNGQRDGEWIEGSLKKTYEGKPYYIFSKGQYQNGKRIGEWKEYFSNDQLFATFNYSADGVLNGKYTQFSSEGKVDEEKYFANGKMMELIDYDSTGKNILARVKILSETDEFYKLNLITYSGNKSIHKAYTFEKNGNEIHHQSFMIYFLLSAQGDADDRGAYTNGEFKVMDEDGLVLKMGKLYRDKSIGEWKFNFPEQRVQIRIDYDEAPLLEFYYYIGTEDLYSGTFIYLDEELGIKEERKIKNGLRNGKTVIYNEKGEVMKKEKYKDGILQ